jgi:hypothetical protein
MHQKYSCTVRNIISLQQIDAILHYGCPCNATELHMFIGCVNYYCDMWPSRAHILKPLTDQSGLKKKAPIKWTDKMQKAFDKMRLLMAANALAGYLNHNKQFNIYTDASDFQLGACSIQEGRPVAYFLQKLTKSQKNCTTIEKKMLSIIATRKEFQGMLLNAYIHVLWIIIISGSILSKRNVCYAGVKKWRVFTHTTLHGGPPQYSSRQPLKAPLPSYTDSDRGGEETRRAHRGFE